MLIIICLELDHAEVELLYFTKFVIIVQDIAMKIMSFSQQGARAICVLSANGTISNVTLRQPTSCGGTLTYEVGS